MSVVRFLDKEETLKKLRKIAKRLKAHNPDVKECYLFGSLANDTYTATSDADILVVLRRSQYKRAMDRIPEFLRAFSEAEIQVDVFPFTEKEIEGSEFLRKALSQAIKL